MHTTETNAIEVNQYSFHYYLSLLATSTAKAQFRGDRNWQFSR